MSLLHRMFSSSILAFLALAPVYAEASTLAAGPQVTTYSSQVRGYWFTTPVAIHVTGLRVPTDASSSAQTIQLIKLAATPPTYSTTTTNYTTMGTVTGDTSTNFVAVDALFSSGDIVGVLGYRGSGIVNS